MPGTLIVIDEISAKVSLMTWARERKTRLVHYFSCARCDYCNKPFWTIVVRLFSWESNFNGVYGFHIYEDGEVKLIGKQSGE